MRQPDCNLLSDVFEPRQGRHNSSPQRKLGVLIVYEPPPPLPSPCIRARRREYKGSEDNTKGPAGPISPSLRWGLRLCRS